MGERRSLEPDFDQSTTILLELGLTPIQSKVYLELTITGGLSARGIVDSLNINRVDVYRALQRLQTAGLVEIAIGNPNKFIAVDPDSAVQMLLSKEERKMAALKEKASHLTHSLKSLKSQVEFEEDRPRSDQYFRLKSGQAVFDGMLSGMKSGTKDIRKVVTSKSLSLHILYGIVDEESNLARKGVRVRIISDKPVDGSDLYSKFAEIRYTNELSDISRYVAIDDNMIFISLGTNVSEPSESLALVTNNSTLIHVLSKNFEDMWESL